MLGCPAQHPEVKNSGRGDEKRQAVTSRESVASREAPRGKAVEHAESESPLLQVYVMESEHIAHRRPERNMSSGD